MRNFSKLVIDEFECLFWNLDQDTKVILEKRGRIIGLLLCLDWIICSFLIGTTFQVQLFILYTLSLGPAEVLFWRGIWESNREILDNYWFQHKLIERFIQSVFQEILISHTFHMLKSMNIPVFKNSRLYLNSAIWFPCVLVFQLPYLQMFFTTI